MWRGGVWGRRTGCERLKRKFYHRINSIFNRLNDPVGTAEIKN